jgi:Protein of unknown function (DUF1573).
MKKPFFALLLATLLFGLGGGQAPAQQLPSSTVPSGETTKPTPHMVIDQIEYNAGEVDPATMITNKFTFKNEGDAPLEIKEVKSGCGCLIANYDPLIQPGENGVISISMKLYPEWEGREVSRTTWVITNDPENRQIRLTLSAKAKAANGSAASAGK